VTSDAAGACVPPFAPLVGESGTRFRLFSPAPEPPELRFYAQPKESRPVRVVVADPATDRRGSLWEMVVPDAPEGTLYNWGWPGGPPLVDPAALAVMGPPRFGERDPLVPPWPAANRGAAFKGVVVVPPAPAAWSRPGTPPERGVVYELHVRGFTADPSSGVEHPGTWRGLREKIPYLRDLGVTAVELLPVHEFDECEVSRAPGLLNFWGYSPVAWCAPNRRYTADAEDPLAPIREFRGTVAAFHEAGIEVWLDVVFNHTAEMEEHGPTWNFKALSPWTWYLRDGKRRRGDFLDLTGCGNTVNANHPVVAEFVRDALRWWHHGLGADGFRFDLGAILCRDEAGELLERPPLLRMLEADPLLADAKLVSEAWDAGGAWLVDGWPGDARWSVWNDRFRDDVRRAWLAAPEYADRLATRLSGSEDLFRGRGPTRGVNYVTVHDGFTLRDVVSYREKHNEANGEHNRDGADHEPRDNHGVEGPTDDARVTRRRDRARRNLVASTLLAQGVPMLLAGDELGRSQRGNNNAYCHDSPLTWVDWTGLERDGAFFRFVRGMIRLRRSVDALHRTAFLTGNGDVAWLGADGAPFDWHDKRPRPFGYRLADARGDLLVAINLTGRAARFAVPGDATWRRLVDTAAPPPEDLHAPESAPVETGPAFRLRPRCLVVLRAGATRDTHFGPSHATAGQP